LFPEPVQEVDVSDSSSATVRADIQQKYSDLFGSRTVNGRQVNVEQLIAQLTRATRADFASLMQARHQLHQRIAHKQGQYDFLDPSTVVTDADGNRATVGDIRQGNAGRLLRAPHAERVACWRKRAYSSRYDAARP
jgi:hypothetical protein